MSIRNLSSLIVLLAIACQGLVGQAARADGLTVAFADPAWDGEKIPPGQHCKKFGGNGATPPLTVSGIPEGANAVIVEFNDKSYGPLSKWGGHGKIGFWVSGPTATLPAVPGGTDEMPEGVFLEKKNRATGGWFSPGYLPPCSGGKGNRYEADVKAVDKPTSGGDAKVLAVGKIQLGHY